jgi:DNA-binding NarL/FixJ family response regulator
VNRVRVLLADDNALVLERVTSLLATTFDVVGIVHDGQELVTEALRLRPDVIVADISMPVLTGIEAAQQIRKTDSITKLVFLTVHKEQEFVEACLQQGAQGYVIKAHMKTDLVPAILAAISGGSFISPTLTR